MKITFGNITPFLLLTFILLIGYLLDLNTLRTVLSPIIFYFVYNIIWVTIIYIRRK